MPNTRYSGSSAMGRKVTRSLDDDVVAKSFGTFARDSVKQVRGNAAKHGMRRALGSEVVGFHESARGAFRAQQAGIGRANAERMGSLRGSNEQRRYLAGERGIRKALIGTGAKKAPTLARVNARSLATRVENHSSLFGGRRKTAGSIVKVDRRFDSEARRNQRLGGYAGAAATAGATSAGFGVRNVMQNRKTLRADLSSLHATHPEQTMSATKWKGLTDEDRNKLLHQHSQQKRSVIGLKNLQSKKPLAISRRGALQLAGGAALLGAGGGVYRHTREQQERWR